jgi:3-isopropylmalate dehydrogenase
MSAHVVVLPGDGVGPEVTAQAINVLTAVSAARNLGFEFEEALIGGIAIDKTGSPLPPETLQACKSAAAVFLGAVGGPKWDVGNVRPEQGLLGLRKGMGLFANLRPVKTLPALMAASPLKNERLQGVDILVMRELTGGIYFGRRELTAESAFDTCEYTVGEIERICRAAGRLAEQRSNKITSVDKANVLDTSKLWRTTATRIFAEEFPGLKVEHLLVDAAAMHLLSRPADFDVMVTENMFGDILTDEASMLAGSMGLLPSASLSDDGRPGLFEPIHGSAPDIAGRDLANPAGAILSVAMMLRYSFNEHEAAAAIEAAVEACINEGIRTKDMAEPGRTTVGTAGFGAAVLERLKL